MTVCWSGKGVYKNYKERTVIDPETKQPKLEEDTMTTMPQLWETRTIGGDFQGYKWDFAQEKPEEIPQVVVHQPRHERLLARHESRRRRTRRKLSGDNIPDGDMDSPVEREEFFQAYLALVKKVRRAPARRAHLHRDAADGHRPVPARQRAAEHPRHAPPHRRASKSARATRRSIRWTSSSRASAYGLGCDYHPNLEVHRIMATAARRSGSVQNVLVR